VCAAVSWFAVVPNADAVSEPPPRICVSGPFSCVAAAPELPFGAKLRYNCLWPAWHAEERGISIVCGVLVVMQKKEGL
jgi:hypothetical protein